MKYIIKISTIMGMLGAILLAIKLPLEGQIVWAFSNPILAYVNYKNNDRWQMMLFVVFEIVTLYGIWNWITT